MTRLLTALLAGTALLGSVGAHALTITQGASVSSVPTDVSGSQIGMFNLFDTTLGTLTSVTFTTSFGFNSTITVTAGGTGAGGSTRTESAMNYSSSNNSAITSVLNADVNTADIANGDGNTAVIGNSTLTPVAYDVTGSRSVFNLSPLQSAQFTSATSNGSGGQDLGMNYAADTNASDLAAFSAAGGGMFTINFSTLTGTLTSTSSGNDASSQATVADAGFGLYYTYTAATPPPPPPPATVPEPASMALLGAGLLGAGLVRRRSRK